MKMRISTYFIAAAVLVLAALILNLSLGSVHIPFETTIRSLFRQPIAEQTWKYIILQYRLPKALSAILVGSGLALSGLLMQTLFRNPLASPYVLGLSSGASLGVALFLMGSSLFGGLYPLFFNSTWGITFGASLGSLLVMSAIIGASLRLKNTITLLIIGLMFASLSGALINVLASFSSSDQLQRYVFWSFGSLGNLSWNELGILSLFWGVGLGGSLFCLKGLNALLLGERYAKSVGINSRRNRLFIIIVTSIFTGSITAFAGPIAFIGLAVPHLVRLVIPENNHLVLAPAVVIAGAIFMLICDTLAQLPGSPYSLPINAVTALFGAPVIIWLLLRKQKPLF